MQRLVFLAFAIRGCLASLEMHQADFKHTPFPEETCRNQAEAKHPLDPLTHDEIQSAVQIIETNKGDNATRYIYNYIALFEPPKSVLLPFFLQDSIPPENIYPRKAFLVLIEWATKFVYEAVVNLGTKQKESYIRIYNVQAPFTPVDLLKPEIEIVLTNELVQERCASLGYPNMNLVVGAPWTMGYVEDRPEYRGKRIVQYFMFGKNFAGDNYYAHPLDFVVIVDLDLRQVIAIEDLPTHNNFSTNNTANSAPKIEANYDYHYRGGDSFFRQDDNPITTSSPLGPYSILGNEIQWQKWKMRVGFNGREGMVVYMVSYNDDGRRRPILYRASVTEIFVPYGDPRPPFHRKSAS
ncbi:copper amine oxidase 1 [Folsomia candida]|uniref:copper amine oxidase 1 n=1 Tax=Folsomia candida TaxID=158441 RepID=UPI001604FA7B|nr:copper amine oxidase 1 [Folsomia candida]